MRFLKSAIGIVRRRFVSGKVIVLLVIAASHIDAFAYANGGIYYQGQLAVNSAWIGPAATQAALCAMNAEPAAYNPYGSSWAYVSGSLGFRNGSCYQTFRNASQNTTTEYNVSGVQQVYCGTGHYPDASNTVCTPVVTCAGYANAVAAATAYQWLKTPITCDAPDTNGFVNCHGIGPTGKNDTQQIACNGGVSGPNAGPIPAPTPSPAPAVDVNFPKCPVGSYQYTDTDGSTSCAINGITVSNTTSCGSLNYGSVNGSMVCLPANPAPTVASAAADAATSKAAAAKAAGAGTAGAQSAATGASSDAQRASDASNSLPTDSATAASAARAIAAAKQAAGYAGVPYTGPGGAMNGTASASAPAASVVVCGVPGSPKCQMDETGTPNGQGSFDGAKSDLNQAVNDHIGHLGDVTSESGKDASWGWLPVMPTGTCTPFKMGEFAAVDWCGIVPTLQQITSWMLGFLTCLSCLSMVNRAIRGA